MRALKKFPVSLGLVVGLAWAGILHAGELSLSQSLGLAQSRSLQTVQAALEEARAKAQVSAASAQLLPQFSAVGRYTASDDPSTNLPDDNEALLKVEENLLPFLSPDWVRAGQQQAQFKASQIDRVATRQDVDLLVEQLYFAILRDKDAVDQVDRVTREFGTLLDYLAPQFNVGRTPRFDAVKVKAALTDLARSRALTLAQLAGEKNELAQVLGLGTGEGLDLKALSTLPEMPPSPGPEGLEENPTLQALGQRVEAARIGLDADNFSRLPSLTADFRYGYMSQTWSTLSIGWDATVELRLPLFDWGTLSAQADQDRADWRLAQNALESQRRQFSSQLAQTQAAAQAYLDDFKRMEALLPETEQASHAALRQYRTGAMGIVETTDAVNLWLQTDLNDRNAYYSYLGALAQLERLTGGKWQVKYE